MTNDEKVALDIDRAGEFLRYLIDNPSEMEKIPSGATIRFPEGELQESHTKEVLNVRKVYEYG
jgi:hypothetical protein